MKEHEGWTNKLRNTALILARDQPPTGASETEHTSWAHLYLCHLVCALFHRLFLQLCTELQMTEMVLATNIKCAGDRNAQSNFSTGSQTCEYQWELSNHL